MVVHGCFSQTIIYLHCVNNNRTSSVLELYHEGVDNFGLPSRVCCDHCMDNTEVARYMLERRSDSRPDLMDSSVITGRRAELVSF